MKVETKFDCDEIAKWINAPPGYMGAEPILVRVGTIHIAKNSAGDTEAKYEIWWMGPALSGNRLVVCEYDLSKLEVGESQP